MNAEKFQKWKDAHYPNASRTHVAMMYAAWTAATEWNAPKAPPSKTKPKAAAKPSKPGRQGSPGDE